MDSQNDERLSKAQDLLLRVSQCTTKEVGFWCEYDMPETLMAEVRRYVKENIPLPRAPKDAP
jgi:hypothetical protein